MRPWLPVNGKTLMYKLIAQLSPVSSWKTFSLVQMALRSFVTSPPANHGPSSQLGGGVRFLMWSTDFLTPLCEQRDNSWLKSLSGMDFASRWDSGKRPAFHAKPPRSSDTLEPHWKHSKCLIVVLTNGHTHLLTVVDRFTTTLTCAQALPTNWIAPHGHVLRQRVPVHIAAMGIHFPVARQHQTLGALLSIHGKILSHIELTSNEGATSLKTLPIFHGEILCHLLTQDNK